MKVKIVTALFDIKRDINGDGRKIEDYLQWISNTLKLKADFVIFTEKKFYDFIYNCRKNSPYQTNILVQDLEEIPFYNNLERIKNIFQSNEYLSKIKDSKRIECYLPEYNLIQYSKFGWIKQASNMFKEYDYFFWMDAGCSRFFEDFDLNNEWPNVKKLIDDKIQIQANNNFNIIFPGLNESEYMWDNNSILVGTLFGMHRNIIEYVFEKINDIFDFFIESNCVNNEQIALAIFAKRHVEKVDIHVYGGYTHLPFFKNLK